MLYIRSCLKDFFCLLADCSMVFLARLLEIVWICLEDGFLFQRLTSSVVKRSFGWFSLLKMTKTKKFIVFFDRETD